MLLCMTKVVEDACLQEFNMSISAAYMRPHSRSESFKVNMIASIDYAKEHHDGRERTFISLAIDALQKQKQKMKLYFPLLLLLVCFILLSSSLKDPAMAQAKSGDCCDNFSKTCEAEAVQDPCINDECSTRCAVAGVQDRCIEYCGICSEECKCVPSGNYGNKHECPCNNNKKGYCTSAQRGVQ
ncbi:hypothetical protein L3X38_043952 [Prunus dulcis]|uniref:Uncharacterized protein n=1 Tax=Prunus dulcis TaxID=3755 RepID=A0AAD4UZH1_PRUDU|nr:hypothetical protein L3X38_043952 [Prunus dulcis]